MAQLRGTTNSFFLGISSQNYMPLAIFSGVAGWWLGSSAWDEFKGDEAESGGDGDAVEMAEKAEEDSKKKEEDAANAAIFAKTIKPLFQECCYECHKGEGAKAKLDLSLFEDDDAAGSMEFSARSIKGTLDRVPCFSASRIPMTLCRRR